MKDIPQLNEHNKEEYPPMHTTEHILNQTMIRLFGCGRAVSAHIERKKSKLDFRFQREPEESEINQIEQQVNRIIQSGLPITTEYITQEEALGRFDFGTMIDKIGIHKPDQSTKLSSTFYHKSKISFFLRERQYLR